MARFLIEDAQADDVLTPEKLPEEAVALRAAARDFVERDVVPRRAELESHDNALMRGLLARFGAKGFLGAEIPESLGGGGLDFAHAAVIAEGIGMAGDASFGVTVGAHNGIGTWPTLYFGSDVQREKYLPGIASGERIAAYCLTEAGSGSDALNCLSTARAAGDGGWILNGNKLFITNAAFADLLTVFAKVDGKPACFLVERDWPGVSVGNEEHKLGLRGSSTCPVNFDDVRVPAENLLGEIGSGHKIVMNTLNLGRFKLGAGSLGSMRGILETAVRYAAGREQFNSPIIDFDLMRAMIADMAVMIRVGESMVYRLAGDLARALEGVPPGAAAAKAIEVYDVECALVKVALSEMQWQCADMTLQIHGGAGFIEDYPAARMLRDARINRIFEGTNEINRLTMANALLKRMMKGTLKLDPAASGESYLQKIKALVRGTVLRTPMSLGSKHMALGDPEAIKGAVAKKEQQTLGAIADLMIAVYGLESVQLRASDAPAELYAQQLSTHIYERMQLIMPEITPDHGEAYAAMIGVANLVLMPGAATARLKRQVADETIARILG